MTDYRPIACGFHDELLVRAMHRAPCELVYLDSQGVRCRVHDVIEDVYARSGEEFLRLCGGMEIRLDRLVRVDQVDLTDRQDREPESGS